MMSFMFMGCVLEPADRRRRRICGADGWIFRAAATAHRAEKVVLGPAIQA
jgi:hypothetical protein